jgi:cobalt/nickel transport system permease protein
LRFFLAYHVNLSVVAGILLRPSLGFLAAFITNLMLAFSGQGITVIGLNTLLLGSEAVWAMSLLSVQETVRFSGAQQA